LQKLHSAKTDRAHGQNGGEPSPLEGAQREVREAPARAGESQEHEHAQLGGGRTPEEEAPFQGIFETALDLGRGEVFLRLRPSRWIRDEHREHEEREENGQDDGDEIFHALGGRSTFAGHMESIDRRWRGDGFQTRRAGRFFAGLGLGDKKRVQQE
jgi:hypothetical protein